MSAAKFGVVYIFSLYPNKEEEFINLWTQLTELIATYEGGLGSRLHKMSDLQFFAYAQWPDQITWQESGDKLPAEADTLRKGMRNCCSEISTLASGNIASDLLK